MSIQQTPYGPVLILKEGSSETKGYDAIRNNIDAALVITELIKTSLGPRGMDKMVVDTLGDVTITNDGATMLKQLDVQHPAAKILVEIAKATDSEVGDGTTSAVVLAGRLLEGAKKLLDKNIHPSIIVDGYQWASSKALDRLQSIAIKISPEDKEWLAKLAKTSMRSKIIFEESDYLAKVVIDAVFQVAEKKDDGTYKVDVDTVSVLKKQGESISGTLLVNGIIVDKEVVHSGMPKAISNAKIALLNAPLEIEKTEYSAEIRISDPTKMKAFLDQEASMLKQMVDKIKSVGANVVFCQKGIDDLAQHYLAKAGIMAVRRVKESDMSRLSKATGGRIVTNIDDLTANDLGFAGKVEERKVEEDKWVFVEECKNPKAVSILIRGGSQRVVDEAERSLHDAIMVIKDVLEKPVVVAGGGAPEMEMALYVKEEAKKRSGREQLAATAFADALEASIPLTLAENAGMDPLDVQVELRAAHSKGNTWYGVDAYNNKVNDMNKENVFEPISVKEQVVRSATEAATMVLRIDEVIASKASKMPAGGQGGPGGMGGMGGMGGEGGMPNMPE
ncbi:MAG: TCP-1/cpn60 chaperonin family protein [Nitrososphaerota archaeon]|jgi:thermosome|nr:TCP-1/cpn60 chaperonin family protein [Nitrososphaerota archaeon]MDG6926966.1 TCP-1/cpn60 chaperonin family protein [Nitrososphaerota archaeon]MDG6930473.1 TCP-1/cpn60 chaperonin family protein [Nitrososphaerota archaeon]MDG6931514.1 TCP-1/cpn60 chaperonin family protein [Nitrososphaerota archaeon]MDG6936381.1 TCP-1/cpn60 chaperonin family protein [Nitrososphaerota archaeon]